VSSLIDCLARAIDDPSQVFDFRTRPGARVQVCDLFATG